MNTPTPDAPDYQKYVLRWNERPGAGPSEYEAAQTRIPSSWPSVEQR